MSLISEGGSLETPPPNNRPRPKTRVYCWGSGAGGALGSSNNGDMRKLELRPVSAPCGEIPPSTTCRQVSAGYQTSAVITENGDCYSWGAGSLGRRITKASDRHTARRVMGNVSGVNHGKDHSAALTSDGRVWVWGDASDGRRPVSTPREISFDAERKCTGLACGDRHTLFVLNDGDVFAFGSNEAGQLGSIDPRRKRNSIPARVAFSVPIVTVDCGTNHSAAVSTTGQAYTWGWGEYGRLGHGDEDARTSPCKVDALAQDNLVISQIACGSAHTVVLTKEGDVFGFGWNLYGQLGSCDNATSIDRCLLPVQTQLQGVSIVSCGFAHTAAVTFQGELFTWGFNEEGQLGLGHEDNVGLPMPVQIQGETKFALSVACGHTHTLCIASDFTRQELDTFEQQNKRAEEEAQRQRVLLRFARLVLLRSRLRRYHKSSPSFLEDDSVSPDMSDGLSSTTSSSEGFLLCHENEADAPICISTESHQEYQESLLMTREDERSKRAALFEQSAMKAKERERRAKLEEATRRREADLMRTEDLAGRALVSAEKHTSNRARRNLARLRLENRRAKANASIQKEAARLKKARERRLLQSSAKTVLPKVRCKIVPPTCRQDSSKERQDSSKENREMQPPKKRGKLPRRRNRALLEQRQSRLQKQERIAREEEAKRKKFMEEEQSKLESVRQLDTVRSLQLQSERERLKEKRQARVDQDLRRLKEKLGLNERPKNEERHCVNKSTFTSAQQWGRALGGTNNINVGFS